MHACMHACIHACMHTYMHAYIHTYIHTYVRTSVRKDSVHGDVPDRRLQPGRRQGREGASDSSYVKLKLYILYCTIRYYTKLYYTILYYTILYNSTCSSGLVSGPLDLAVDPYGQFSN